MAAAAAASHFTASGRPGRLRCFLPGRGRGRQEAEGPAAPSSPLWPPFPGPSGPDRPLLLRPWLPFLLAPGVRLLAWPHTRTRSPSAPRTQPGREVGPGAPRPTADPEACPQGSRSPPPAPAAHESPRNPQRPEPRGRPEDRVVRWAAARPRLRPEPEPAQKEGKPEDQRPTGRHSPACRAERGPEGGASLDSHLGRGAPGQRWG